MKNLLIAVLISLNAAHLSAQDISLTSVGSKSPRSFYVDLLAKAATLDGGWGLFGGMKVGYNLNRNVSLGLTAHGMIPNTLGGSYVNQNGSDTLHFGYGGVEASYNYYLSDKFYLTGMLMVGAGRVDYENLGGNDYFFIMEPGVSFTYLITEWFGLGFSADYRLAAGVNYADFSNASFSGWSTDLSFKFRF
jgi:hypothetical protein